MYRDDKWCTESEDKEKEFYSKLTDTKWNLVNFDDFLGRSSTKGLFIADYKRLKAIKKILENELSDVEYVFSSGYYLEVLKKVKNKGRAVKELLKSENISKDEITAFGDHQNDYEMLKYAK